MKRNFWMGLVAGALALTLILGAGASTAAAAPAAHGGRGGQSLCGQAGLDAAAKALKLTTDELNAQLWGGQTLSGLADKAGVELTTVQAAVQAACVTALKDSIQQAVTDGTITQAQADWLMEGLDKGYWGGDKGGIGFGRHGGTRGFMPRGTTPNGTTTPNSGTTSPSRFVF